MSTTHHTPEPWRIMRIEGHDERQWVDVVNSHGVVIESIHPDNARRIVACVNACAGIPTEALEGGALHELLNAVEVIKGSLAWEEKRSGTTYNGHETLRVALAELRGEG